MKRPIFFRDLFPAERQLFAAMKQNPFSYFECLRFKNGQLILAPWPQVIKNIKFGSKNEVSIGLFDDFELNQEVAEFFEYVRTSGTGEIRRLVIRHSVPFSMEVICEPNLCGGRRD
jgi:hypothetical protein